MKWENVTTKRLDVALRMCGIELDVNLIDRIIDVVEMVGEKGGNVTLDDAIKLRHDWFVHAKDLYDLPCGLQNMYQNGDEQT
jgi:hypothetical protein